MKNMRIYKGILVAKGTELNDALDVAAKCKPNTEEAKAAQLNVKRVATGIEERFNKLYPEADRNWFYAVNNKGVGSLKQSEVQEVVNEY